MSLQPDKTTSPREKNKIKNNERAEVRYFKGEEQFERWRKEFIQHQDNELKLAAVSKFSYEPADYEPLLVQEPFPELVLTDHSYLIDKAVTKTEDSYVYPLGIRVAIIISLFVILVIFFSPIVLLITVAMGVAAAVSLHFTRKDRDHAIKEAEREAREEMERRNEQERLVYEEKRRQHEVKETARLALIQQLLTGASGAVRARLDEVLSHLKLPVVVEVDIDFFADIPFVKVWLPSKAVIPKQTCEMLPSGRLQFQDKDTRVFNKQYFELCGAIILQVVSTILANIPSFQEAYAAGIVKNDLTDDCILSVKIPKEEIASINRASSAIPALQAFAAIYECDTSLTLYPVEMLCPPEWEEIDKQEIKSLKVRIFQ
ncbi:hypothetical protein [Sporomusa sp. KB1]|jgi:hypothetical protein|uniref:hypothetical protein n=1 Tax=Sporomusa sp. KB1 TaxID=943346 RepID=UPI0011A9691D|nr:hypothetical protein [Sporomusa sp. KB1]TWH49524.1 hypothetical protein Salpa_5755 [Sporomusa sp. KB1]